MTESVYSIVTTIVNTIKSTVHAVKCTINVTLRDAFPPQTNMGANRSIVTTSAFTTVSTIVSTINRPFGRPRRCAVHHYRGTFHCTPALTKVFTNVSTTDSTIVNTTKPTILKPTVHTNYVVPSTADRYRDPLDNGIYIANLPERPHLSPQASVNC